MSTNTALGDARKATDRLTTKIHFEVLDGMRGVAAVAVVIFHFMEIAVPDYTNNFIAHGHLAVDFFFCLSGFVIAYAYDQRIKQIGIKQFIKLRLVRLQPLVVIGAFLGLLTFLFDPFHNLYAAYGPVKTLLMLLTSCLMIPFPVVPERYNNLFHFNPPTWSLFWEYVVNIFYAVLFYRLHNKVLWALAMVSGIGLCYAAAHYGHLSVGWGADNVMGGPIRVTYSFLAGMLVYRTNSIIRSRLGFVPMSILLLLVFLVPFVNDLNYIIDPVIVLFCLPLLVGLGAGATVSTGLKKLCRFSGEISYPLYMVHYPFIWLFFSYVETTKPGMPELSVVIVIGAIALVTFAYLVMRFIDVPVRKYFINRMKRNL